MRRMSKLILALSFFVATPPARAQGDDGSETTEAEPTAVKKKKQEVLDLNQVDLEQVEEDWDSAPKQQAIEPKNRLKLNDIIQPSSDYSYASFGKADPFQAPELSTFQPTATKAGSNGATVDETVGVGNEIKMSSPLQAYPLAQLKVKGVWKLESGEVRSLVQTPKNEGVVVKAGDPISSGKVVSIDHEVMVVRLYKVRKDGVREYVDQRLPIGEKAAPIDKGVIKLEPGKDAQFIQPNAQNPEALAPASDLGGMTPPVPGGLGAVPDGPIAPGANGANQNADKRVRDAEVRALQAELRARDAEAAAPPAAQQPGQAAPAAPATPVSQRPGVY